MERYIIEDGLFYDIFLIGERKVFAPSTELKRIQKEILRCIKEKFNIKLNIKNTANIHCKQKWLLKLDIKDFYNSVPKEAIKKAINYIFPDIRNGNLLDKRKIFKYCTVNDKLPVGAITSAHLANLAFYEIEKEITQFCKKNNINYSRYMDDMFFSCDDKKKLNKIENFVQKLLKENSYNLNENKVKYISDNKQQSILGVVVNNNDVKIKNLKKREYRSLFFNYIKSIFIEERLGVAHLFHKKINFSTINGHLSYLKNTDPVFYKKCVSYITNTILKFQVQHNDEIKILLKLIHIKL